MVNDQRFVAAFMYHHGGAPKCVNLGAAIKEAHKGGLSFRKNGRLTKSALSAACAKNRHSNCTKLNCTCGCHKGGIR